MPGSRTPSVSSNHPQPQVVQGDNENSSNTLGAMPPSTTAQPSSAQVIYPADQLSPALQQPSHSQHASPAGGTMVELMPPLIQSSDNLSAVIGSHHERNDRHPVVFSPNSSSPHHPDQVTADSFGPRAITPSATNPPSGKNQGYPSPHPPGSPLKGKPHYQSETGHPNGIPPKVHQRTPILPPRTDYVPLCKPADNTGGWDLKEVEEIYSFRVSSKPRRSLDDLGTCFFPSVLLFSSSFISINIFTLFKINWLLIAFIDQFMKKMAF